MKEIEKHIEVLEDMQHMESMNTSELDSLDYAIHFLKSAKEVEKVCIKENNRERKKRERYFIVYYTYGCNGFGCDLVITKGTFINNNEVSTNINKNIDSEDVVLTNIQELSKEDYNEFIK